MSISSASQRIGIELGWGVMARSRKGAFWRVGASYAGECLAKDKSPSEVAAIETGAFRLSAPAQMGEIFKVLAVASSDLPTPAGFEAP